MSRLGTSPAVDVQVRSRGQAPQGAATCARKKVLASLDHASEPVPVPVCAVPEAVQRLDLTGLPFVFFADTATGRGGVLHHRYDGGHCGLITPTR